MKLRILALILAGAVCGPAWTGSSRSAESPALADRAGFRRPDSIPFPSTNPYSPDKAALGKALFFEPRLSGAENMTCASCHNPSFGWEARNKTAVGAQNTRLPRHAPTILDVAWVQPFFWDGRAATAEEQAKGPIENPIEMNLPLVQAAARLNAIPEYKARFARVFPGLGVTPETIVAALATYERTVVSSYAPFDAWVDGDEEAISASAKHGFSLFTTKAQCVACHTGWNFTDNRFHDTGTTDHDIGRGAFEPTNTFARFAFKTPSLRDTALRSPYMHAGQYATLEDVVAHYVGGGLDRPSRSPLMTPLTLSAQDASDLVEFMKTLTGTKQVVTLPILPN